MALPRTLDEILRLPRVTFLDRGLLPSASGIYFVLFEASPVRLAYIGKAENFKARWTGHHREPDLQLLTTVGIAVEIAWANVADAELDQAEREMIGIFKPPLNERATRLRRQHRINLPTALGTAAEIVQDFRDRRNQAVDALRSDEFWADCNGEDGDLLSLWPFPDEAVWPSIHDAWSYRDSHPLTPFRVPYPPAFEANRDSGAVVPKDGFHATSVERRQWVGEVAAQVDAWLVGVAAYHASAISNEARREVLGAVAKEQTVSDILSIDAG